MTPECLSAVAGVLPSEVVWRAVAIGDGAAPLFPEEAAVVARAVARRQAEFAAGRQAAREALSSLCGYGGPVPSGSDRAPVWPPGVVGSISHDDGLAVAAVARSSELLSLGIDIDTIARFKPDLERLVCTPGEISLWLHGRSASERQRQLALVFCIKEAVYKAQYPLTKGWLDFVDLALQLPDELAGAFTATLQRAVGGFVAGHCFEGRCAVEAGRCVAALVLRPPR